MLAWLMFFLILSWSPAGYGANALRLPLETENLLRILATKPELMNLDYLQYHIGRPENERSQRAQLTKIHYWYDGNRQLRYELYQVEPTAGQVVESTFVVHMPESELTFNEIEGIFGGAARRFYDYQGYPTELYSFVPNTNLLFTSPKNTFRVQLAKVSYRGPALNKPPLQDVMMAKGGLINRALLLADQGSAQEAVPLLMSYLKEHPDNGHAHCALGRAYRQQGHLHEAIVQYKAALYLASSDEVLRAKCLAGLQELRVVPSPTQALNARRNFELVRNGQGLRVGGPENIAAANKNAQ